MASTSIWRTHYCVQRRDFLDAYIPACDKMLVRHSSWQSSSSTRTDVRGRGAFSFCYRKPQPKFRSRLTMTAQAQSSDVVEIASAAAFGNGQDVIGVPETSAVQRLQAPLRQQALFGDSAA